MITVLSRKPDDLASPDVSKVNKEIVEYCGLSTDEKPTGLIVTGSTFFEVDTNDLYIYSEETQEWMKFIGGGDTPTGTIQITENGSYDVANYANAEVDVSSDLTIANVTFIRETSTQTEDVSFAGASIGYEPRDDKSFTYPEIWVYHGDQPRTYKIVLSEGKAVILPGVHPSISISGSGGCEYDGNNDCIYVTGDGTITLADGK